jgi:NADP-dependent aldehyde dehydrogenase
VLLPNTLASDAENWAQKLASSLTLNVGQFCTSPGLLIGVKDEHLDKFIAALTKAIEGVLPGHMLHSGISSNYSRKAEQALSQPSVTKLSKPEQELVTQQGTPILASVPASEFLKNPLLEEEVFGPFALIVECRDKDQMVSVIEYLQGQLTATVIGNADELIHNKDVINLISQKAGRLIVNGVPTGVEVCPSMNHGGPFPASSDSRFTSVGIDAIKRFVRPLAFQNFPQSLLPKELQDENPLGIWRLFNNEWRK